MRNDTTPRMRPADRRAWILTYIGKRQVHLTSTRYRVDILDLDFVCAYIDATGVHWEPSLIGAPRCPTLGADLLALHKAHKLERRPAGIGDGLCFQGFPRWVWSYCLPPM